MIRALLLIVCLLPRYASAQDLASWNEGKTKTAILEFVRAATTEGGAAFVRPEDRIAVFDFDGTLIVEQPAYGQMAFCAQQVEHRTEPRAALKLFRKLRDMSDEGELSLLSRDDAKLLWGYGLADASSEDVQSRAYGWFTRSWHPRLQRARIELLYEPMLQLVRFLQDRRFKVFIVTGSVQDYVRSISEEFVGVPKENIIGSALARRVVDGQPSAVERLEEFKHMVDGEEKVLEIDRRIGRRPLMAFGNSDGDVAMVRYATSGPNPGFGAFVHHDDAAREYAYDRDSPVGKLAEGLDLAPARGWNLISVKSDWKKLFSGE